MYKVLLYYKYTQIADPEDLRKHQFELCQRLGMKGRILVSTEGFNGTVAGSDEAVEIYMQETEKYPGLDSIDWKISEYDHIPFPKLKVKVREEVVTLKADVSLDHKAPYIEPSQLRELLDKGEEVILIDARNNYEARIGTFKGAITPDIDNFRDFPKAVAELEDLKDKPIVTFCTGGIRCEKASAYMIEQGFKNVRQLHGGIVRYGEVAGGKDFLGTCYVFDERIHLPVNNVNPEIISECLHCGMKVARYVNCKNVKCNKQFICCEECEVKHDRSCSEECHALVLQKAN